MHSHHAWLNDQLNTIPHKSVTADAIRYTVNQAAALIPFLEDGRIDLDDNAAECALRAIGTGRKSYLFLGSDAGGERAATMYSLLGMANSTGSASLPHLRGAMHWQAPRESH